MKEKTKESKEKGKKKERKRKESKEKGKKIEKGKKNEGLTQDTSG